MRRFGSVATEGFLLGIPAIAVSLAGKELANYETAARVVVELVQRFSKNTHVHPWLLNVNVPDIAYERLKGRSVTRLGKRHRAEPVIKSMNPRGETVYWVGPAGQAQDAGEGTDFHAIANHHVSITPLQVDLTQFGQLDAVHSWLGNDAA